MEDTNRIELLAKDFGAAFYTWENTEDSIKEREAKQANYMTDNLVTLNYGLIRENDGVSSVLDNVEIYSVKKLGDMDYAVTYVVKQTISRPITEIVKEYVEETELNQVVDEKTGDVSYEDSVVQKEVQKAVESTTEDSFSGYYTLTVHVDEAGNHQRRQQHQR